MTGLKQLRQRAEELGGVSYSAVERARGANLYMRIGAERLSQLSERFYARVYGDQGWFRDIFANTTKEAAMRNQVEFLTQEFGGPRLYEMRKGHTALLGRHGPYQVDGRAAERWLEHMEEAIGEVGIGEEERDFLRGYFGHMAWYVVVGKELVNPGRVVGYFAKHREGEV